VNCRYNNAIPSGFFDFGCFYYAIILPSLRDFFDYLFLINAIKGRMAIRPYYSLLLRLLRYARNDGIKGRMAIRPYKQMFGQFFVLIFWAIRELPLQ
jgi:hypothetical protein